MWPFTSKRIFGNRWWAIAFVVFVCWQASDFVGSRQSAGSNTNPDATADAGDAKNVAETFNAR